MCYGRYGCFSDDAPFDRPVPSLPGDPREIGTQFLLYTRLTRKVGESVDIHNINVSLKASAFNTTHKVRIIIHGYTQSGGSAWVLKMVKELLKREEQNVFVVDWSPGASILNLYDLAAGNTRLVGVQVAELVDVLSSKFAVNVTDVHIIGHSLGAQTAGFAGESLVTRGKTVGRITGADIPCNMPAIFPPALSYSFRFKHRMPRSTKSLVMRRSSILVKNVWSTCRMPPTP